MSDPQSSGGPNRAYRSDDGDEELDDADDDDDYTDDSPDLIFLPFQAIKEYPSILNAKSVFLKNEPIHVRITNVERTTHPMFHPNVYEIEIKHAGFYWTIRRRYQRIHNLRRRLQLHALSLRLSRKTNLAHLSSELRPRLPALPKRVEFFVTPEQLETRRVKLEKFLQDLLNVSLWREHAETLRFLEVSTLSFMGELGEKGKEMPLKKLSGRWRIPLVCSRNNQFCDIFSRWKERWILVKDTYYAYMSTNSNRIANVLLIDRDINIIHDPRYSTMGHKSVVVRNSTRDLVVKFREQRDLDDWLKYFYYVMSSSGAQFIKPHPNGSAFPVRDDVPTKWFIDGAPYMSAVADALELAQEEIFITDWWLTPEIYMKRPITEGERWRLDRILQRKAEAGIKVYVLLYKEVPIALGINSWYSKDVLTKRHPNIKVQRHPDHIGQNVWLWSHHEKLVIVDQKIAFVSGIDLCYGRWDDHLYRLTDIGPVDAEEEKKSQQANGDATLPSTNGHAASRMLHGSPKEDAPPEEVELRKKEEHRDPRSAAQIETGKWRLGQPFKAANATDDQDTCRTSNNFASLVSAVQKRDMEEQNQKLKPKPPPARRSLSVPAARAMARTRSASRETVDSGNGKVKFSDDSITMLPEHRKEYVKPNSPKFKRRTQMLQNAIRLTRTVSHRDPVVPAVVVNDEHDGDVKEADLDKLNIKVAGRLWLGKDYCNEVRKAFAQDTVLTPELDQLDRHETPRMPWHDAGAVIYEHAARDVARHFIQRWNACKVEKNQRDTNYSFIVPKSYDTCDVDRKLLQGTHNCRVQLLRSVCSWSAGLQPDKIEDSIHQAYIHCIQLAQHYIYIENQFFITLDGDKNSGVSNGIGEALFQRIRKAFTNKERFRVYVVMPVKPGIEGEYGTDRGAAVQAVTHWNYQSICRGGHSLYERISNLGADPTQYLSFCGMRTYGEMDGKLITELIYVHSKLMIVDDLYTIIGSANINDRSMLGVRDSEVAIVIKDREFDETTMDGKPFQSGRFSGRFRRRLMKVCLGIWNDKDADSVVADAVSEKFYDEMWNATAENNEKIYEDVFACLPSNSVFDFIKLAEWEKHPPKCQVNPEEARESLKGIKGYLCKLALQFLKDQNLTPAFNTRESILPVVMWT